MNSINVVTATLAAIAMLFPVQAQQCAKNSPAAAGSEYEVYTQRDAEPHTLSPKNLPAWVTFDGEGRLRLEDQTAINLLPGKNYPYALERVRAGMELRIVPWLNTYVQIHDLHALGLPLQYTASNMRDTFDLRQAYIRFHLRRVEFTAGRQLLNFGNERIIGISDWTQASRSFDGFDLRIGEADRVEIFSASVVNIYPTSLDMHMGGLSYHGAYASLSRVLPRSTAEPFLMIKAMPHVVSRQNIMGTETEVTPGLRLRGYPGRGFEYDFTGTVQRGSYANDSIHAASLLIKVGYLAKGLPWYPHLDGEYDYATGSRRISPNRVGTFDQQYPSNHNAFGLTDLFGFQNIAQYRLNLELAPVDKLTLLIQGESLRVATAEDDVYKSSGSALVKPPGAFLTDRIGTGFDVSAKYIFHKYLLTQIGVGHFFPGEIMTHGGQDAPLTISWCQLLYRFKVN